ncbi:hypothetical protein [Dactylosporangium sp. NPDC049140]|uniref:hypothetical protein n=1 Tax=Dactylosporangium sp. NPDC049140 TaxID=3155647 RepID=UPI0033FB5D49
MQVRHGFEVQAARLAATQAPEAARARLAVHTATMERSLDDFSRFAAADMLFRWSALSTTPSTPSSPSTPDRSDRDTDCAVPSGSPRQAGGSGPMAVGTRAGRSAGHQGFFGSSPKPLHCRPPLMQYWTR